MLKITLVFAAGILALQFFRELPPSGISLIILPLLPLLCLRRPWIRYPVLFLLGLLWAGLHAQMVLDQRLPATLEGRDLQVRGVIVDLPEDRGNSVRLLFRSNDQNDVLHGLIRLNWYHPDQQPMVGEEWQLTVRIKRPHGFNNPGGFDYERWLFEKGITATGYVRTQGENHRLAVAGWGWLIDRARSALREEIFHSEIADPQVLALITALAVGDKSKVSIETRQAFIATGTVHLLAISGLHISIFAGFGYLIVQWLWRRSSRLLLWLPAPLAGTVGGVLFATLYAALAGFSLPTQRALIMLLIVALMRLLRREIALLQVLSLALLAVLLYDPLALISAGFWLSFGAVGLLVWGMAGRYGGDTVSRSLRSQWAIAIGLLPVLTSFGIKVSLVAPVINLLLIPLFSLVLIPLILSGIGLYILVPVAGEILLKIGGWVLSLILQLLHWISEHTTSLLMQPALSDYQWWLLSIGVVLLLLPRGLGSRLPGVVLLLMPMVSFTLPRQGPYLSLTMLDVGQGLSLVIQTRQHLLVYDVGPQFSSGFSAATAVLTPYLRSLGVRQIDRLMLSNGDSDHAGAYQELLKHFSVTDIFSGEPNRLDVGTIKQCRQGERWSWDGVSFALLAPDSTKWQGNDASCVLQVSAADQQILIPGDISSRVERWLLSRFGSETLRSSVVVVPHHGSLSSSSQAFVDSLSPMYALVSSGFHNRYGFPKAEVVKRWRSAGAHILNTAETGAVQITVTETGELLPPTSHRLSHRRYWSVN